MGVVTGASFNRGNSEQDVCTPDNFLNAVERRFGPIDIDLAATEDNRVAHLWWGPGSKLVSDSLDLLDWPEKFGGRTAWLNPPFGDIAPWAERAAACSGRASWLLMLCPASVGSRWFQNFLAPNAFILELVGRLTFKGHTKAYPKDLILACFGYGMTGREAWEWRTTCGRKPSGQLEIT